MSLGEVANFEVSSGCSNSEYKSEMHVYLTQTSFDKCSQAEFMNPSMPSFPQIGLATVPGSGNTWTRVLLEKLTGVRTGSVFSDQEVYQKRRLTGEMENWDSRKVSFIKFHPILKKSCSDSGKCRYFSMSREFLMGNFRDISEYYEAMNSFIIVNRNLVKNTIAEFNRRKFDQVRGFQNEREFIESANTTTHSKIPDLVDLFHDQTLATLILYRSVFATGKRVLVLSHEDMTRDLLTQLLRIVHFLGRDTDPHYAERALCTFYSEDRIEKVTKRTCKMDFITAALSVLNRSQVIESIQETEKVLRQSKPSYSDVDAMIYAIKHK